MSDPTKSVFIERYGHLLALAGVMVIALFLRTYQLTAYPPGLYWDEAMNGNNALEAIRTGEYKLFYPENYGREGLFINIQALFLYIFGLHEPWVLRLPSAIFGTLTVLGVYLLAREFFGKQVGLFAAFLIATSFWHLVFSRIGFRAITAPFYGTWGLWLLVAALRVKRFSYSLILSLSAGLVLGLGLHSYIAYRVMPIPALLLFLLSWPYHHRGLERLPRLPALAGLFMLGFTIAAAPLLIHFIYVPQDFFSRTAQTSILASKQPWHDLVSNIVKTAGMFHFDGDTNWRHNFASRPELYWPVGIFFLIGLALAIRRSMGSPGWRSKFENHSALKGYLFCLAWLAAAFLPVVVSNNGIPHALRAILMTPPIFILSACGGRFLDETIREKLHRRIGLRLWGACVYLLFGLLYIQAFHTYFYRWGPSPITQYSFNEEYVKLGRQLLALPPGLKKYVIVRAQGVDVRGLPAPTQTIMFITDTFLPEGQREKNIYYVMPENVATIPAGARVFVLD